MSHIHFELPKELHDEFTALVNFKGDSIAHTLRSWIRAFIKKTTEPTPTTISQPPPANKWIANTTCQFCKQSMPETQYKQHYQDNHEGSQL